MSVERTVAVYSLFGDPRLESLGLELLAGKSGLTQRFITNPRIQKPGLALAGYLPYVKTGRLQILGESEYASTVDEAEKLLDLGTKEQIEEA